MTLDLFCYTVACRFESLDPQLHTRWLDWLRSEHIGQVLAAGASSAEIIQLDDAVPHFEIRYRFADRTSYERYVREDAPRLRAEGLEKFPLELGLAFSRSAGKVIYRSGD